MHWHDVCNHDLFSLATGLTDIPCWSWSSAIKCSKVICYLLIIIHGGVHIHAWFHMTLWTKHTNLPVSFIVCQCDKLIVLHKHSLWFRPLCVKCMPICCTDALNLPNVPDSQMIGSYTISYSLQHLCVDRCKRTCTGGVPYNELTCMRPTTAVNKCLLIDCDPTT